ncbi:MAG TPA: DUF1501 domain-containing protein [Gemmataceae bacterium]|jgi:hypothetical protein|nr:DUF1501 domain-containing protein [Gemmataceae bacterium]
MTDPLLHTTRRHFFRDCGVGLGAMALGSMLGRAYAAPAADPLAPKKPHFEPKAKAVIFLFMAGGPSQFELFEPKPELQKLHGQPIPESFVKGRRFAFMNTFAKERPKLLGTKRKFARAGDGGLSVSELFPHFAGVVDQVAFVRTVATDVFNHAPAKLFLNTGSPQFGRPAMGSWLTYGLGSESQDLPGFVVLQSGPRGPRGGTLNWGSGFLPSTYQGVPFRSGGDPVVNLSRPTGITADRQKDTLDAVADLNKLRLDKTRDPEIATRIAAYEMAYRMQTSAPDLIDLSQEDRKTLDRYGATPGQPSFANNCVLARRLVERGVRFVQLYHTDWDHHGDGNLHLDGPLEKTCQEVDRPTAALLQDLEQRGLTDSTLVVWGGEFGRTPMGEIREKVGRNHHIDAFPMWLAGAGVKKGLVHGETDEFGFAPTTGRVHVHDIQATILHLLGLEHTKLTYRFQGRDFRLTDVHGEVIRPVLA